MKSFFTLFLLLSFTILQSQSHKNQKAILGDRFEDYSGQFFYFENGISAELFIKGAEQPYRAKDANLNLITKSIEVKKGDKYVKISRKKFVKVLFDKQGHTISMIPAPLTEGFIFNLYETSKYKFFDEILPTIESRTYNIPGKVMERKFVRVKHTFTLYIDNTPHTVELKKKGILKLMGKEAQQIAKETKNKLKNEWDVVALLVALEEAS